MNEHLREAIFGIKKADALMHVVDLAYSGMQPSEESWEDFSKAQFCYHAIWDAVRTVSKELEALEDELRRAESLIR